MKLIFNVTGNLLELTNESQIVSGESNVTECEFSFDSEWDGFARTVLFQSTASNATPIILEEGVTSCNIPPEITANKKVIYIGVVGIKGGSVLNTNWKTVKMVSGANPNFIPMPTDNIYAQIIKIMQQQAVDASISTQKAAEAIDSAAASLSSEAYAYNSELNAKASENAAKASENKVTTLHQDIVDHYDTSALAPIVAEHGSQLAQKANQTDVYTQIAAVASGAPKGVYSSLLGLQAARPSGDTNIYLTSDNGHWYYWNGSAWTDGGTYQSTGIADKSVTYEKTDGVTILGKNIYTPSMFVTGYIDNTGAIVTYSTYGRAKIPVDPNKTYSILRPDGNTYSPSGGMVLFTSTLSGDVGKIDGSLYINGTYNGKNYITVTTPANCAYIEINAYLSNYNNTNDIICVMGDVISDEIMNDAEISTIFNSKLKDTKARDSFDIFIQSIKRKYGNLYTYPGDFVADKYINTTGIASPATGWGYGKVSVEQIKKYSIYLPHGDYTLTIGAIGFYQDDTLLSYISNPSSSGTYNGVGFVTVTAPANCNNIRITNRRPSSFDNSTTMIVVEGESVNDNVLTPVIVEINGVKIPDVGRKEYTSLKWGVVGDSLTEHNIRATKNYHDYISEDTGITVVNLGKSGTGYKKTEESNTAFYQRILNAPTDINVLTIFGSGNDLSLPLGNITDTTTDTLCGCINKTIDNFYSIMPTVPIGIITPSPWSSYPTSTVGNLMELYSQALIDICKRRSIPCLDLYHCSNLRPWDSTFRTLMYSRDGGGGVHPDENGHKVLASKIREFLKTLI